jgi:hypothetical protein
MRASTVTYMNNDCIEVKISAEQKHFLRELLGSPKEFDMSLYIRYLISQNMDAWHLGHAYRMKKDVGKSRLQLKKLRKMFDPRNKARYEEATL